MVILLSLLGFISVNIKIRVSSYALVVPNNSVIIAAAILFPSQGIVPVALVSTFACLSIESYKANKTYLFGNFLSVVPPAVIAYVLASNSIHLSGGVRIILVSLFIIILNNVIVSVDDSLENGNKVAREIIQFASFILPDFVVGYAGGLAAYSYLTYGLTVTTIAASSTVFAFLVIRNTIDLDNMYDTVVKAFLMAMRAKDEYTYRHSLRVAKECGDFAKHLGWNARQVRHAYWAGAMHDIGKLSVSLRVIRKPGRLTDEEFAEMKSHNIMILAILGTVGFLTSLVEVAADKWAHYNHREHGTGNETAELVAMLDAKDAMATTRSYHQPKTREQVLYELFRCRRKQFNPHLVHEYFRYVKENDLQFGAGHETDRVDFGYEPPETGFESAGLGHTIHNQEKVNRRFGVREPEGRVERRKTPRTKTEINKDQQ